MLFNSIKEINRLRNDTNKLLIKGMPNNWRSQNFNFLGLKNLPPSSFRGAPTHADITKF